MNKYMFEIFYTYIFGKNVCVNTIVYYSIVCRDIQFDDILTTRQKKWGWL